MEENVINKPKIHYCDDDESSMDETVINKLKIHCEDENTMKMIRQMLFVDGKDGKPVFTMQAMLPIPEQLSGQVAYHERGWRHAVWGTWFDVCESTLEDANRTIIIDYETSWSPNHQWVKTLCEIIQQISDELSSGKKINVYIEHQYYTPGFYGAGDPNEMHWEPGTEIKYDVMSV
jgi:hypothetical protein